MSIRKRARSAVSSQISLADVAARIGQLNHDIRTPIGTVATAIELLRGAGLAVEGDDLETLQILDRQVTRLTAIAESLRDLAEEAALPRC